MVVSSVGYSPVVTRVSGRTDRSDRFEGLGWGALGVTVRAVALGAEGLPPTEGADGNRSNLCTHATSRNACSHHSHHASRQHRRLSGAKLIRRGCGKHRRKPMRTSLRAASRLGWSGACGGCGSSLSVSSRTSAAADLRRSLSREPGCPLPLTPLLGSDALYRVPP